MLKRTLYTFLAAAVISAPALMAPAAVTPAAAQEASLNISLGGPVEFVPAPRPGYLWNAGYWRYEHGRRFWEHGYWRDAHRHAWR